MIMSPKEIFEFCARHLLTQKQRSYLIDKDGDEYCVYHGENGLSCAVGCLIPKELDTGKIERSTVDESPVVNFLKKNKIALAKGESNLNYKRIRILELMQDVHDAWEESHWKERLKYINKKEGFESTVLEEFE